MKNWDSEIKKIKKLSNKQLIETINYKYENNLNDDDYIAELVRRRKATNKKIAIVEEPFTAVARGCLAEAQLEENRIAEKRAEGFEKWVELKRTQCQQQFVSRNQK